MPAIEFVNKCKIAKSFVASKVASAFDLDAGDGQETVIKGELPELADDWQVGLIVGPSGCGKTSIARHAYEANIVEGYEWSKNKAFVDDLGKDVKAITSTLNSIGLNSVPSWLRPFRVLSNGEQFRATLARAMMSDSPLVVMDEFTSVVDRQVAQIGCAALRKALKRKMDKRFIGVTCHFDIVEWLEPDWVLDMSSGKLTRRRLRRPEIKLDVYRCDRKLWSIFRHHHYLNTGRHPSGRYFVGCIDNRPVAWCSLMPLMGKKDRWRFSRIVVLPEFQGIGIGTKMMMHIAEFYARNNQTINITTSHPAMVAWLKNSADWKAKAFHAAGVKGTGIAKGVKTSYGRAVAGFKYSPSAPTYQ